jgi:hypothetical protein
LIAFDARVGRAPSIVHWGQFWFRGDVFQSFQTSYFQNVRDHGAIPMVSWASMNDTGGIDQPKFKLSAIADGAFDAQITRWAQAARAWGHPFFLRFDWEMNGWWQFPWSEQVNGNKPGDYVRAWRHVHDIFTSQGATNATWVWCPNVASAETTPLPELYPGDAYVDWTCMDGYNWGNSHGFVWQSFSELFGGSDFNLHHNTYAEVLSVAPRKPIMIGETATSVIGGDAGQWVTDALTQQLPANFPRIKAVVWFNWNANDASLTWPIESAPEIQTAFAQSIASGYFTANTFGNLANAPIVPPDEQIPLSALVPTPSTGQPGLARPAPSEGDLTAEDPGTTFAADVVGVDGSVSAPDEHASDGG